MADAATSPSRKVQNLAESQELDKKISAETDALRQQINTKNKEIEGKTKELNKLEKENKKLQQKLNLITDPSTEYSLIIDQGGGSFSAYLFGSSPNQAGLLLQLEKYKSTKSLSLQDPALSEQVKQALGHDMHSEDGSMNDYSFVGSEHYPLITKWFAAFYTGIEKKILDSYGSINSRAVRQTGKIRAHLMEGGNEDKKKIWNDSFNAALGPNWDYKLLTNEEEARTEGQAFYHFQETKFDDWMSQYKASNYVGVGIGSSSTQGYCRDESGKIFVSFDSVAGAKPTKEQKEVGEAGNWRTPEQFCEQYKKILEPIVTNDSLKKCVIATNAVGYLCAFLTHPSKTPDWPKKAEFKAAISNGKPIPTAEYQVLVQSYVDSCDATWDGNFVLGFLNACVSFEQIEMVALEQKQHNGKGLPIECSWVMYLAETQLL